MSDTQPQGQRPSDLDPTAHPIIAAHWFGLRPIGVVIVPIIQRIGNQRGVPHAST
jgi:hypothetical protein